MNTDQGYNLTGAMRSGQLVRYRHLRVPVAEFALEGRDEQGTLHLWRLDGRWRCLPGVGEHPCDLVAVSAATRAAFAEARKERAA